MVNLALQHKQSLIAGLAILFGTVLAGESPKIESRYLDVINSIPVKITNLDEVDLPITVYFHGGCFIGGFETHDAQLRQIALLINSMIVAFITGLHRHTYPAAHDDVYQAVLGVKEQAHKYGGDSEHLVFIGDSAGGTH
ncbi:alpha/beta hydrolase [Vibrio chagasii]|nr:alpha/beta hydrolase [Vibrio chagasii]